MICRPVIGWGRRRIFSPLILVVSLVFLSFFSCAPAKYVPEGKYLLDRNRVHVTERKALRKNDIRKSDIKGYIPQQPNHRIFGFRFNLWLYNLSNPEKDTRIQRWLRRIGEPPVILDTLDIDKSSEQITTYLQSESYFNTSVKDSFHLSRKRAEVFYHIDPGRSYVIHGLRYDIADSALREIILGDTMHALIKRNIPFQVEQLDAERKRVETLLRDSGYYAFSRENVRFLADSAVGNNRVDVTMTVSEAKVGEDQTPLSGINVRYRIRKVYFFVDYDPQTSLENQQAYYSALDTTYEDGFYYVAHQRPDFVKRKVIRQANYIKPGSQYSLQNVELTRMHLSGLKVYKFVNVYFTSVASGDGPERIIDCHIQLSPVMQQSYAVELEGTNSSGNLGGALNLQYQHRNLFHGAEIFRVNLKQSLEALAQEQQGIKQIIGSSVEAELTLPQLLLPLINTEQFIKKYNPKTNILLSYNYQRRPDYRRTIIAGQMGYSWMSSKYASHLVSPINVNAVNLSYIDPSFLAHLDTTTYLAFSYRDVFIPSGSYSYIYDNKRLGKTTNRLYLRFNAEFAGNLLYGGYKAFHIDPDSTGSYHMLGLEFAQYVKSDIDIRYTAVVNDANSFVFRGFAGVGIPYLNSRALPFEKQYYAGGANGIRAWQVRSLGPGSYVLKNSSFYNQTADMKLEANVEYRFKLFWVLEGALFMDAGNIWAINKEDDREGALFRLNSFMKDIAIGTGVGARFDFNYFLFRLDLGMKLRDPALPENHRWILSNRAYQFSRDFVLQLGIGYPF